MPGQFGTFFKNVVSYSSSDTRIVNLIGDVRRLQLKNLKSRFLDQFWMDRPNKQEMFLISMDQSVLDNIDYSALAGNIYGPIVNSLKIFNHVVVDNAFNILNEEIISGKLYDPMCDISQSDRVVMFFGPEGIDTCIGGQVVEKLNIFYGEEELSMFAKKFHISQLHEALEYYQNHKLSNPASYRLFFADLSIIDKINKSSHKNVLRNSPEKDFRDHLLDFLNDNTQHDFHKEIELVTSKRETDLFTEWNGKKYLIEIKWLGITLNKTADAFTKAVTDVSARDGVVQTLEYIRELIINMDVNLKCGYLLVFDARNEKKPIDYRKFSNVPADLQNYLTHSFQLLQKLDVTNTHPA